jgi:hypothetical protein
MSRVSDGLEGGVGFAFQYILLGQKGRIDSVAANAGGAQDNDQPAKRTKKFGDLPHGRRSFVVLLRHAAGFSTTTPSFVTFFSLYATIRYLSMSAYLLGVLRHLRL